MELPGLVQDIVETAGDLMLSDETKWANVPEELRRDVEVWMKTRA
jgi:hypothetical protein